MRIKNKNFAEAFRWLKAHKDKEGKGVKYQKDLAALVGVSDDTITRIMRDQTDVTDDFLCKFNEAFDNVFNYQWLRGEDNEPKLAADLGKSTLSQSVQQPAIDPSSMINAIIAAHNSALATKDELIASKDDTIAGLKRELSNKDELIISLRQQLLQLQQLQRKQSSHSPYPFPTGVAENKKI